MPLSELTWSFHAVKGTPCELIHGVNEKVKRPRCHCPHCREWSSAGAHRCVYGSLSFEPWTCSHGHFKKPFVSRLNSSAAVTLNFSTANVTVTDRGGSSATFLRAKAKAKAKAKASWWWKQEAAPLRHGCLTSSVALHDVAQLRNTAFQTKLYLQAIKNQSGFAITSQYLRNSLFALQRNYRQAINLVTHWGDQEGSPQSQILQKIHQASDLWGWQRAPF